MTDKELDKLFREKFAAADHEFQESSWEKAKTLLESEDPAVVDDLVRRKFAAQQFAFNEGSWTAAKAMVAAMYRRIWFKNAALKTGVFIGILALSFGSDALLSDSPWKTAGPTGRPAVAFVQNPQEVKQNTASAEAESVSATDVESREASETSNQFIQNSNESPAGVSGSSSELAVSGSDGNGNAGSDEVYSGEEGKEGNLYFEEIAENLSNERKETTETTPVVAVLEESESSNNNGEENVIEESSTEVSDENKASSPRPSAPGMFNSIRGKSSYFGLSFGARIYEDFSSTGTGQIHFAPTVGLRYAYMFHPKLSLNIGANYSYRRSTHNGHEFSGASYSFGAHKHTMSMVSSEMHQADIPLYIRYQLARGHYLYAGGYANITLASKNETTSLTTAPFASDQHAEESAWGHMPGLRQWGYGMVLGYDVRINENWQIGIRGQWGLVDWSENDVFVDSPYDRNKEVKILLEYRLND